MYLTMNIIISGGPLSALTCCINVRSLSGNKKNIAVNLLSKSGPAQALSRIDLGGPRRRQILIYFQNYPIYSIKLLLKFDLFHIVHFFIRLFEGDFNLRNTVF